jgi:hypothetical protein
MKNYYVYYSYEEWGRGYIGYRVCECPVDEDIHYFGSFFDKSFCPSKKIILATFLTREEAVAAEILLHNFFEVNRNPHFANRAKQTSVGYSGGFEGKKHSEETRSKMSESARKRGKRPCSPQTAIKIGNANRGKKRTEEAKEKMRQSRLTKRWIHRDGERTLIPKGQPIPEGWNPGKGKNAN